MAQITTKTIKDILNKCKNFLMQTIFSKAFMSSILVAALVLDVLRKGKYGIIDYIQSTAKELTVTGISVESLLVIAILVLIIKK